MPSSELEVAPDVAPTIELNPPRLLLSRDEPVDAEAVIELLLWLDPRPLNRGMEPRPLVRRSYRAARKLFWNCLTVA